MYIRTLFILFFAAALLAPAAYAGQKYIVTLTNGNTLTANYYRLEGRKVYLKYPVGEVALPASEVAAVSVGDGSVELLQINGELKPPSASAPAEAVQPLQADTSPGKSSAGQQAVPSGPGMPKSSPVASFSKALSGTSQSRGVAGSLGSDDSDYDPVADSLAQQLATADDKQAMEITQKLKELLANPDGPENQ